MNAANPLRRKAFRLLFAGETASGLGSGIALLALPLLALGALHASALEVSLLTAAEWAPWLVVGLPAGVLVDRISRRRAMIAADLLAFAAYASIPAAWWLGVLTIGQLLGAAFLGGVALVLFRAAYRPYVASIVPTAELPPANAALQGSEAATQVGGPGVAGLLAATVGAAVGVLVDALSFLVSAACLWRIGERAERRPEAPAAQGIRQSVAEGWHHVRADPYLRRMAQFGGASNAVLNAFGSIQVAFLTRTVGLGPGLVGVLVSAACAGGVVGAVAAPTLARRCGTARVLVWTKVVAGVAVLAIPLTGRGPGVLAYVLGSGLLSAACVAGNVVNAGFVQTYVPAHLQGRVTTSMQVVNLGPIPVGATAGGLLAAAVGLRPAMWVLCALVLPVTALIVRRPFLGRRDLPTAPRAAQAAEVAARPPVAVEASAA